MKLSITQMVLGLLVVVLACFVVQWMLFGVASLIEDKVPNDNGLLVQNYTPRNEVLFSVARYISAVLPVLGLIVLVSGALWWKIIDKKRLAIAQVTTGVLLVIISAFIVLWGYTFDYIIAIKGGPVLDMESSRGYTIYTGVFGLAITSIGIAQLVKAKKIQNIQIKEQLGI